MTDVHLVADVQRAAAEDDLTRGGHVLPSVVYLADGQSVGALVLSGDPQCTLAAVALPFRICPEISLASLAMNGALANLATADRPLPPADAFSVIQFHRDKSWVVEIVPYIQTDGMLVWDVAPRVFDDLDAPDAIQGFINHLYHHVARDAVHGPELPLGIKDRFLIAGTILIERGDAIEVRVTKGTET